MTSAIGNIFQTQWWEEREASISLQCSPCDLSGSCTHAVFCGSFAYSYPKWSKRRFLDLKWAILSKHGVFQVCNKSIIVFLKGRASTSAVQKPCHGMFSEQLRVCSTSTEIMEVLLLKVSCFTSSCYSSRREVSYGPVSCPQSLLAADPCPLWRCARHWFTRDAVKCCILPSDS